MNPMTMSLMLTALMATCLTAGMTALAAAVFAGWARRQHFRSGHRVPWTPDVVACAASFTAALTAAVLYDQRSASWKYQAAIYTINFLVWMYLLWSTPDEWRRGRVPAAAPAPVLPDGLSAQDRDWYAEQMRLADGGSAGVWHDRKDG